MNAAQRVAALLVVCAAFAHARPAAAQAPCSTAKAVTDSARSDAIAILSSDRPLVLELRQEQGMTGQDGIAHVRVVRDRGTCARIAGAFDHIIPPGQNFVVLRIGPIYYARDPNQRFATGVFTDSTFHVIMRLGAAMP